MKGHEASVVGIASFLVALLVFFCQPSYGQVNVVKPPTEKKTKTKTKQKSNSKPSGYTAAEKKRILDNLVNNMVYVAGGTFMMGSNVKYRDNEQPVHKVTVSGFSIGRYEVTQAEWKAVMGNNPSEYKGDKRPVENVTWAQCQEFIRKLNSLTGRKFRLPTEAEWEFAARGGNKSHGYTFAGSNDIGSVAWYCENSRKYKSRNVGTKRPNELGLYDMTGNVEEWVQDWYGSYSAAAQTNPKGPSTGEAHVVRSSNWDEGDWYSYVSAREMGHNYGSYLTGFRLAL